MLTPGLPLHSATAAPAEQTSAAALVAASSQIDLTSPDLD